MDGDRTNNLLLKFKKPNQISHDQFSHVVSGATSATHRHQTTTHRGFNLFPFQEQPGEKENHANKN